ncbi:MAG: rplL [Anaerosporomusa subterranea]|nr:rplL [Anaerosporomusa subterranea]
MNKEQIMEAIEQMTVLELSELVKALEEKFGVSAAAPVAMAAAPAAAAPAAAEEQTEFDVILTSAGAAKINVIKVVRERLKLNWLKLAHLSTLSNSQNTVSKKDAPCGASFFMYSVH